MVKIAPPCQSMVRLFFVVVALKIFSDIFFLVSKILVGNSPAGPPTYGCHEAPLPARKYTAISH